MCVCKLVHFDRTILYKSYEWLTDPFVNKMTHAGEVTQEGQEKWFNSLSSKPDYKIWGFTYESQPIGVSGLKIKGDGVAEYFGYIGESSYRGKGVGSVMLSLTEKKAYELGIEKIILAVRKYNEQAIRFYKKNKYIQYGEDAERLFMEKDINKYNMKNNFVLLGGNMLCRGTVDKLHEFGYNVIVVDWNEHPAITGDLHIRMDVKDSVGVVNRLSELRLEVDGAISFIDLAAPTVNAINAWCGNVTMPEQFNKVLSKEEMRVCWMRDGIFNRISKTDDTMTFDEVYEMSQQMKLIIKPNVAASSRGITIMSKGQSEEVLLEAMKKAKDISFDNKCLIEEFVEGREFTVDMLGDNHGNVCVYNSSVKYHSHNALNNHTSIKLHWNSNIYSDEQWDKIAAFGISCYKSIGLKNMFGHLEVILKDDGTIVPVEIGARSSGFICSHMVSAASGHDYLKDYIRVLHGEEIKSGHYLNGPMSSMWFGYDIPQNTDSVKESNLAKFLNPDIKVIYSKRDGLKVPAHYGYIIDDNTRDDYGYEMLVGPRDVLTIGNVCDAEQKFLDEFLGRYTTNLGENQIIGGG